jgi:cystathionine beta-lyase
MIDALRLFRIGASWGSTQSVVSPQKLSSPGGGLGERLIRFSIGLEPVEELKADIAAALDTLSAHDTPLIAEQPTQQKGTKG